MFGSNGQMSFVKIKTENAQTQMRRQIFKKKLDLPKYYVDDLFSWHYDNLIKTFTKAIILKTYLIIFGLI